MTDYSKIKGSIAEIDAALAEASAKRTPISSLQERVFQCNQERQEVIKQIKATVLAMDPQLAQEIQDAMGEVLSRLAAELAKLDRQRSEHQWKITELQFRQEQKLKEAQA